MDSCDLTVDKCENDVNLESVWIGWGISWQRFCVALQIPSLAGLLYVRFFHGGNEKTTKTQRHEKDTFATLSLRG